MFYQLLLCMTKFRTLIVIACNVSLSVSLMSEFGSSGASRMFEPDMPQKAKSGMEQSQALMVYHPILCLHFYILFIHSHLLKSFIEKDKLVNRWRKYTDVQCSYFDWFNHYLNSFIQE